MEDEAALVAQAQRDRRAFALLYDSYVGPIYRYCYRMLGNREAAEDATSETFMKALAALPKYRARSFRGWLFTIAHNVATDSLRRKPIHVLNENWDLVDHSLTPEEHALADEARQELNALLGQLTVDQRSVVELRLAGLSGAEIAQVLGRSPQAVKSTQFRAYERLRRLIGRGED